MFMKSGRFRTFAIGLHHTVNNSHVCKGHLTHEASRQVLELGSHDPLCEVSPPVVVTLTFFDNEINIYMDIKEK